MGDFLLLLISLINWQDLCIYTQEFFIYVALGIVQFPYILVSEDFNFLSLFHLQVSDIS